MRATILKLITVNTTKNGIPFLFKVLKVKLKIYLVYKVNSIKVSYVEI